MQETFRKVLMPVHEGLQEIPHSAGIWAFTADPSLAIHWSSRMWW